jgi:hypothetical protein
MNIRESKTRALVREIEKRGSMKYSEMQYFLWNYDHVNELRPLSKPSRGYWCTNLLALKNSDVIHKKINGKQTLYTVADGASNWKTFYGQNGWSWYPQRFKRRYA